MHLFFEGVTPAMYRHWSGQFFSLSKTELNKNNIYFLKSNIWEKIGKDMIDNSHNMPSEFGHPPNNIKYYKGFKAEEWMNWTILYSIPLLLPYMNKE
jgi:hypothetical protein